MPALRNTAALLALLALAGCQAPPTRLADAAVDQGLPRSDAPLPAPPPLLLHRLPPERGTYVVVAADPLVGVAEQFAALRRKGGYITSVHRVSDLVPGTVRAQSLARELRDMLAPVAPPIHLLLLGDAPGPGEPGAGQIPAATCTSHHGGCMTDNLYGDLDGDGLPEVAVGRVPAHTAEQARAYLERLEEHESRYTPGPWNRRLSLYTERGGFGPQADSLIELGMMEGLKRVSHAFDIVGAYDNPTSAFYYTPYADKVLDLFNQGNLFVFYVGHGLSGSTAGLDRDGLHAVHCAHRRPGVFFFACNNGAYVGPEDSIAEALLFKEDGAIVAFASSDVSHPYGNASLVYEVTRMFLDGRPVTYGEGLRRARRALVEHHDDFRQILDDLSIVEVPPAEQPTLRAEHVNLYNLLGDPAAAVRYPGSTVAFDPVEGGLQHGRITVSGSTPGLRTGSALVTLEVERDVLLHALEPVDPELPDDATVQRNWARAVDKVVAGKDVPVEQGVFSATLTWTPPLPGSAVYVKVYARDQTTDSFGFLKLP